jgi:uncharacterized protein (DUF1330 family)
VSEIDTSPPEKRKKGPVVAKELGSAVLRGMPKAYVIVDVEITDPEKYDGYRALAGPAVEAAGGRYIARGGATEVLEGDRVPNRIVIIEFDDLDSARAWYDSPLYVEARAAREGASTGSFIAVEGV